MNFNMLWFDGGSMVSSAVPAAHDEGEFRDQRRKKKG
jgi:hypothetical protein